MKDSPDMIDEHLQQCIIRYLATVETIRISTIQRKFKLAYGAASDVLETLQVRGIVGPAAEDGSRPVIEAAIAATLAEASERRRKITDQPMPVYHPKSPDPDPLDFNELNVRFDHLLNTSRELSARITLLESHGVPLPPPTNPAPNPITTDDLLFLIWATGFAAGAHLDRNTEAAERCFARCRDLLPKLAGSTLDFTKP